MGTGELKQESRKLVTQESMGTGEQRTGHSSVGKRKIQLLKKQCLGACFYCLCLFCD